MFLPQRWWISTNIFIFNFLINFPRLSRATTKTYCYPFLKSLLWWVSSICKTSLCSLIEPETLSFPPGRKIFSISKCKTIKPGRWQAETGMNYEKIVIHLVKNFHDSQGGDTCLDYDWGISCGSNSQFVSKFPGLKSVWISVK